MAERTSNGRPIRLLNIVDEYTRECLRIKVDRKLKSSDVSFELSDLFIEPESPWENGYIESFYGKLRDELLNAEIFDTILEARVMTENWKKECNTFRPQSSLG